MMALNSASGRRTYGTVLSLCFRSNIGCRRWDNRPSGRWPAWSTGLSAASRRSRPLAPPSMPVTPASRCRRP